ncbi:hypothetical protein KCP73_25690 [Salmonella enterica subsp. enterica]|nr:hypothetical protein KCP73_25690 [Salmonella enterica subsp. enterica]
MAASAETPSYFAFGEPCCGYGGKQRISNNPTVKDQQQAAMRPSVAPATGPDLR